jgi:hypothetical protein
MLTSGDVVAYASAEGPRHGQVIDVRCTAGPAGTKFTYIVGLDGVREPIAVTDRVKLTKISE